MSEHILTSDPFFTEWRMKSTIKLSSEERRASIIKAVRRVFAEKGFHGTTTRELAMAAGVSEALLFKHFPNKEALYSAMEVSCCNEQDSSMLERLKEREALHLHPGTLGPPDRFQRRGETSQRRRRRISATAADVAQPHGGW